MKGTPLGGSWRRLIARLFAAEPFDRLDDAVSYRADAKAVAMGLRITRIPGTRVHVYRHDVWDRRQEHVDCGGTGLDGGRPCGPCAGTGVLTHDPATPLGGRR